MSITIEDTLLGTSESSTNLEFGGTFYTEFINLTAFLVRWDTIGNLFSASFKRANSLQQWDRTRKIGRHFSVGTRKHCAEFLASVGTCLISAIGLKFPLLGLVK